MKRRRLTVPLDALLARSELLRALDERYAAEGYKCTAYRGWRWLGGAASVRVVWRNDQLPVSTIVATVRDLELPF